MPYEVTSIRDGFQYQAIVPRQELATTIIRFLAELGLTLDDFRQVVSDSQMSPAHIMTEEAFNELTLSHPEMVWIYDSIVLHNHSRMYFHTNWTVGANNWQAMSDSLAVYRIQVKTLTTPDLPYHIKTKTKLEDAK